MTPCSFSLAASTGCWIRRSGSVAAALDAIFQLGLRRLELNAMTPAQVAELPGELARRGMSVQSLHHPCPWPMDPSGEPRRGPEVDGLASPVAEVRSRALSWARATIDLAHHLGAVAVVLHLGRVEMPAVQGQLFALLQAGDRQAFAALRDQACAQRQAARGPHLRSALASIRGLGAYAARAGVALGVEVRDGLHEIPSLAEFDDVFAATEGLPVYYWHDVGHAEKQQQLGLGSQSQFLRAPGRRLLGVHLHDCLLDRDHLAPGSGQIDLAAVARMLPEGVLRTLELGSQVTMEEAERGLRLLADLGLA